MPCSQSISLSLTGDVTGLRCLRTVLEVVHNAFRGTHAAVKGTSGAGSFSLLRVRRYQMRIVEVPYHIITHGKYGEPGTMMGPASAEAEL